MKKFKLFAITLLASSVALSGCLLPKKKSSTDTSDPTSEEPIPTNDWTDAQKKIMKDNLQGIVLPFVEGTFTWKVESDDDGDYVFGSANDTTAAKAEAVYKKAQGWEYIQDDDYGDPIYGYDVNGAGAVIANIYDGTNYGSAKCCITAYYYTYPVPTTDTEWNKDVSDLMVEVLGEKIPFYQFGEDYTAYENSAFEVEVLDFYPEDLTAQYCAVLEKTGSEYEKVEAGVYVKDVGTEGAKIQINVAYDNDYGNDIIATFIPVKTDVTSWSDIPVDEYETHSEITIPPFTSTEYTYYSHRGVLYIEGVETTDITETYEAALDATTMLYSKGSAVDWYEKLSIQYGPMYKTDSEGEITEYTGFALAISKGTQTSTFTTDWPSTEISAYLEGFEFDNSVPEMTNSTGLKVKSYEYSYEAAFVDGYTEALYYSYLIEAFGGEPMTDAELEEYADEYAKSYAGYYVCLVDKSTTLVAAYNDLFDTNLWDHQEVTPTTDDDDDASYIKRDTAQQVYHYWTEKETGLTLCVYNDGNLFCVQICEPGEPTPVPGESVSITYAECGFTNAQEVTSVTVDAATNTIVTFDKGSNSTTPKYYDTGAGVRVYGSNTITITSDLNIAEIVFTFGTGSGDKDMDADTGTYSKADGVWTANELTNKVTLTVESGSGHLRVAGMAISFAG